MARRAHHGKLEEEPKPEEVEVEMVTEARKLQKQLNNIFLANKETL